MTTFAVQGRCIAAPPPHDWREQLTQMLGASPRRVGTWAELGLYGALRCLLDAGETSLPPDAIVMLGSVRGTYAPTELVLEQMRDGLPMPFTFLQTQSSQLLALIGAQLQWSGHAGFVAGTRAPALLRLTAAQMHQGGALLGWVDQQGGGVTNWLRLLPADPENRCFVSTKSDSSLWSDDVSHIQITPNDMLLAYTSA